MLLFTQYSHEKLLFMLYIHHLKENDDGTTGTDPKIVTEISAKYPFPPLIFDEYFYL